MGRKFLGMLVVGAFVFGACSSDDKDSGSTGSSASTVPATSAAPVATGSGSTAGAQTSSSVGAETGSTIAGGSTGFVGCGVSGDSAKKTIDPNGTLVYAHNLDLSSWDPDQASVIGWDPLLMPTYDRLIHVGCDGKLIPGLAESWKFSDDGLHLQMKLRQGVKFHDGTDFNADAAKANIERAADSKKSLVSGLLASVTGVDVVDPSTIDINLSAPNASLLSVLSDRPGMMVCPGSFDDPGLAQKPCGAGMFTVSEYRPGDTIKFDRFAQYWAPQDVKLAHLEIRIIPDPLTRLNAVKSGQVDSAALASQYYDDAKSAGLQVLGNKDIGAPETATFMINLNKLRPPFDDVRVRQALEYAVDRNALVDAVAFGHGTPNSQILGAGSYGFNDELGADYYKHDPAKAKQLLADAGVKDLSFSLVYPAGAPGADVAGELVQAQFADAGIKVTLDPQPVGPQVYTYFWTDQHGDALITPWASPPDPSLRIQEFWAGGGGAVKGFVSPDWGVTDLFNKSLTETDPAKREDVIKELVKTGTENALDIFLFDPAAQLASTNDVVSTPVLLDTVSFRGVAVAP